MGKEMILEQAVLSGRQFVLLSLDRSDVIEACGGIAASIVTIIHAIIGADGFGSSAVNRVRSRLGDHGLRVKHVALLNLAKLCLFVRNYVHQAVELLLHLVKGIH